jgi:stearoyl-CoA desaturase (delta-9 desaturase)
MSETTAITVGVRPSIPRDNVDASERIPTGILIANLLAVVLPLLGFAAAALSLWGWGFSWVELGTLVGMSGLTAVGITVGFHRLFTHGSFKTHPVVQFILAALGSMAVQGPLLQWVATHRRHHQLSDAEGDPHSPHLHGAGFLGLLKGIWHAHVGWIFEPDPPDLAHYVRDLRRSRSVRMASVLFVFWVAIGLLIPAALGLVLTGTWMGALGGLVWGGLARIFLVHHITWSINSICHVWGGRPYRTTDQSRNNLIFGVLALGEGWHNNHHAFPTSARHGLRWWQIDMSYWLICALEFVGLAWNIRLPARRKPPTQRRTVEHGTTALSSQVSG